MSSCGKFLFVDQDEHRLAGNAEHRDRVVNPQIHRAWLLPESDIAIYEQRPTEFNDAVVESMQVLR